MKEQIRSNINSPAELEVLFQQDSAAFEKAFREMAAETESSPAMDFWMARLNYMTKKDVEKTSLLPTFNFYDLLFLIGAVLIGWAFLKIPDFTAIHDEAFMMRNVTLSGLPAIALYWIWKRKIPKDNILPWAVLSVAAIAVVNLFPVAIGEYGSVQSSDTFYLSCVCLPILLWIVMGIFLRKHQENVVTNLLRIIPRTGELLVTSILISIAWGVFYGITLALFNTINIDVSNLFEEAIIPMAISTPLIAVLLTEAYPQLALSLTSFLARCFVPIVVVTFLSYFIAMVMTPGQSPFASRDFLIAFNVAALASIALILFSLGSPSKESLPRWVVVSSALLSITSAVLTIAVIYFLISRALSGGITPNRFAALGVDVILGVQLVAIAYQLFSLDKRKSTFTALKKAMTIPLYYYGAWAAFVIFAFPLIFQFR